MSEIIPPRPFPPFPPIPIPPFPLGPAQSQLPPSTLAGAIGSDFISGRNVLLFVEYGGNLSQMALYPTPQYQVLGTGYTTPEDVKASVDGAHAYVTERTGDLVRVALSSADRCCATVVASGMVAPQQLCLDEANGAAYVVEYAPSGCLWRIDLASGTKTAVLSGLENAVGVVLSADRQFAYVSEQMSGSANGRVSRYQLSNGAQHIVATGFTAPFFLSWMDSAETVLLMPERDPVNRLRCINVITGTAVDAASDLPVRPSSAVMANAGTALVCCNDVIDEIFLAPAANQPGGNLLEGIGWVPFDWIEQTPGLDTTGLANTVAQNPSYFYPVADAPFGGRLPVMVNFAEATAMGASHYVVKVDGNVRTDPFSGAWWNGSEYVAATNSPVTIGTQTGLYPVYTAAEAEQWTALPGCYLDSTNLDDGLRTITVDFYAADGVTQLGSASPLTVRIDNRRCTAVLQAATLAGTPATPCGFLNYTDTSETVELAFQAAHAGGYATFGLGLLRGVTGITGVYPSGVSGSVTLPPTVETLSATVESLLTYAGGSPPCSTAAFAAYLSVYATAQTGWGRCGGYDASAAEAFMLAP